MALLKTEQSGPVLTVRMDNPPYNFLDASMMRELETLLIRVDRDPSVRAVVLTSAVPDVFISHYDVGEILWGAKQARVTVPVPLAAAALRILAPLRRLPGLGALLEHTPAAGVTALLRYHAIIARMRRSDRVYVAAINGRALGGGCELALGCDIRVMAEGNYEIGQPEILVGLLPGGGGIQALSRSVGIAATIELALEGRPLTPREAHSAGIVHHLVASEKTLDAAVAIAQRLGRRSPAAVGAIKYAVYSGATGALNRGLAIERARFMALATRPETKKAMLSYRDTIADYERSGAELSAFVEQRLPDWLDGTAADFTGRG